MFFPDRATAYREAKRVLKPGGRFLFSVWDRIEENEFAHIVTDAVAALFPDNPPRFFARTPHGYYDIARIEDELRAAGFTRIDDRDGSASQPGTVAARCGGRAVPGHAVAIRNRGACRRSAGGGDQCRGFGARGAFWHRRDRRQDPGAYCYGFGIGALDDRLLLLADAERLEGCDHARGVRSRIPH